MNRRPLVELSQTTFSRTLCRDLTMLDGHVPPVIRGRTYDPPAWKAEVKAALVWGVVISVAMAIATFIGTHY